MRSVSSIVLSAAGAVFMLHCVIIVVLSPTVFRCKSSLPCFVEKIGFLRVGGVVSPLAAGLDVLNYELGMTDNVLGSFFGYVPLLVLAAFSLFAAERWLALRAALALAAMTLSALVANVVVLLRIRDAVSDDTVAFAAQNAVPLACVCVASCVVVVLLACARTNVPARVQYAAERDGAVARHGTRRQLALEIVVKLPLALITLAEAVLAVLIILLPTREPLAAAAASVFGEHFVLLWEQGEFGISKQTYASTVLCGLVVLQCCAVLTPLRVARFVWLLLPSLLCHFAWTVAGHSIIGGAVDHTPTDMPPVKAAADTLVVCGFVISLIIALPLVTSAVLRARANSSREREYNDAVSAVAVAEVSVDDGDVDELALRMARGDNTNRASLVIARSVRDERIAALAMTAAAAAAAVAARSVVACNRAAANARTLHVTAGTEHAATCDSVSLSAATTTATITAAATMSTSDSLVHVAVPSGKQMVDARLLSTIKQRVQETRLRQGRKSVGRDGAQTSFEVLKFCRCACAL